MAEKPAAHERQIVYQVPGMESVGVQRDLMYKSADGVDLKMDVYTPADLSEGTRLPGVVFVHGGPVKADMQPTVKDWGAFVAYGALAAASGLVGVTFNHRYHNAKHLEQAEGDIIDAIGYARVHAHTFHLDPERLCVWVYSGGGPLVSFALRGRPGYLRCLVIYYALLDLRANSVPVLVARAGKDSATINATIDQFVQEARAVDAPVELLDHPEGVHGFDLYNDDDTSWEIIARSLAFIQAHVERPVTPLLRTPLGSELLAMVPTDHPTVPADDAHVPLTFAIVVPVHEDGYVFVYHPVREEWEIPGGSLEPGETLEECAARELQEESGQVAAELRCRGVIKMRRRPDGRLEYGAVYEARIDTLRPFTPNREAARLAVTWEPETLDGYVIEFGPMMIDFCKARQRE